MRRAMALRSVLVLFPCALVAGVDFAVNASVRTPAADFHPRSTAWSAGALVVLLVLFPCGLLPSRLASLAAGVAAGGVAGNLVSAALHGGRVPNPLTAGAVAFNAADLAIVGGAPFLVVALARVAIRNRSFVVRHVPPRRWERGLRRRLDLDD